jgi:hypothetical protein
MTFRYQKQRLGGGCRKSLAGPYKLHYVSRGFSFSRRAHASGEALLSDVIGTDVHRRQDVGYARHKAGRTAKKEELIGDLAHLLRDSLAIQTAWRASRLARNLSTRHDHTLESSQLS